MSAKVVNTGATMTHRPPIQEGSFNALRMFGGSFDKALCEAIMKADLNNLRLIEKGFPEYVEAHQNPDGWDARPGYCPRCAAQYSILRPRHGSQLCCQFCAVYDGI